jgi:formimidoylglutamate deiminase
MSIYARCCRLPGRYATDVRITIEAGRIGAIRESTGPEPGDVACDLLLPGMTNLHSHAFQRALAGLTEVASGRDDDFWSWRTWMYRFLERLTPDDIEAIAAQLFVENLRHGYTSLVEFHYLQHAADGTRYQRRTEIAERLLAARAACGIALTLLPVLYRHGGFADAPLEAGQRRFATGVEDVLAQIADLRRYAGPQIVLGAAPHSLRAAGIDDIRRLVAGLDDPGAPLHIHVAEQRREVDASLAATGRRPLRLLLDEIGLDPRWCVVHATHLDRAELRDLAASGAVAGLCPSTEADLGDGLFRFGDFVRRGGHWGVGGDSHVCTRPLDELRWLEYGQRLARERRNLADRQAGVVTADALWDAAARGGAQAAARAAGAIAVGRCADLIAVELADGAAAAYAPPQWLSQAMFGGAGLRVGSAWIGGERVIQEGAHPAEPAIRERYLASMQRLLAN